LEKILSLNAQRSINPSPSGSKSVIFPAELEQKDEVDSEAEPNHDLILMLLAVSEDRDEN
jgi:hypothetical protein